MYIVLKVLTKRVVDLKAIMFSPFVEVIRVVGRRDRPPYVTTNFELNAVDFEHGKKG